MNAMPFWLTSVMLPVCPGAVVIWPAITLGLASQTRFSEVKLAPAIGWLLLPTCWKVTVLPALILKVFQFRMDLLPTWLTTALLPLVW